MKKAFPLFIATAVSLLSACQSANTTDAVGTSEGAAAITTESFGKYLREIASDELEGRKPFTTGETKTLEYLEREFKELGLEPGNGNSFYQEVPMVSIYTNPAPEMTVKGKQNFTLQGWQDYVIWTQRTDEKVTIDNSELVFAGFGIVAPEYNWNDYAGLDVKDKVVVIFVNDPGFYTKDPAFFKGETMTYYGRWTYKFEEAARQGAKGCLIIHDTKPAGYGFEVVQNNWNTSKLYLDTRGNESYKSAMEGWVSNDIGKKLLTAAGMDYKTAIDRATKRDFKPVPMNMTVSTSMQVKADYDKTNNFIAKITGSVRPDEAIIYSAHWDHLGYGKADEKGDSIYNGAVDDASGVAGLLEIAKAFKAQPGAPERSIVFLAVTAEEQGLWGSAYYAANPVFPKEKTVANLNMDMLNFYGNTKDIVLYGMGQSELEDIMSEEAKKVDRYVVGEPNPEAGLYYRSDHFNFAKIGVPALFIGPGVDMVEGGKEAGRKRLDDFYANYYHKPSDEVHEEYVLEGAVSDIRLLFQVGRRLANSNEWPKWKPGSEFKAVRDAYMQK